MRVVLQGFCALFAELNETVELSGAEMCKKNFAFEYLTIIGFFKKKNLYWMPKCIYAIIVVILIIPITLFLFFFGLYGSEAWTFFYIQ